MDNEPKLTTTSRGPSSLYGHSRRTFPLELGPCRASCGTIDNLTPCDGCRVIYYCNTEHEAEKLGLPRRRVL
ncbi:hypothetical protein ACRE_063690 [Hapsidospora chrysogenum ATCC 11550]|uniref:MYND-type domain-containing protein n=1 Tax=Hapsidospora chrysogenum (strain ATCC 11550 / CBS 779.69 / DSM 880 / IAM 14645 / JCM 23072 / IMI 49137) TaxID=857340 RepID=A0A086T0K5_HAPC1|nr:hypothetical protein ACRE_063690 [Hapsidospora chrysogenum ATCC 11550]